MNLFNSERIIIGGGMSQAGYRLFDTVIETIKRHSLKISYQACSVVQAQLGDQSGMLGAAVYARDIASKVK